MNIAFLEDSTPVGGMLKATEGTVYQVFDNDGNCIIQQFVVSDAFATRYSPAEQKPIEETDPRFNFYHPFTMAEPRTFCAKFDCPSCHSNQLEEIMTDVQLSTVILAVDDDGDLTYGDNSAGDTGDVDRFQCAKCGKVIAHSVTQLCEVMGVSPPDEE